MSHCKYCRQYEYLSRKGKSSGGLTKEIKTRPPKCNQCFGACKSLLVYKLIFGEMEKNDY